jgi:PAS domain S-box-containing protein
MNRKPNSIEIPVKRHRRSVSEQREFDERKQHRPLLAELYRRAEASLRQQKKGQPSKAIAPQTESDPARLLHELEVHQIELELQNTELRQARDGLEVALENYTDLYDFAPAGYFTIDATGTIRQVNLTGAQLVGIERSRLVGRTFAPLVAAAQRPAFNLFIKQVFGGQDKHSIEVELPVKGLPLQVVRVRAKRSPNGSDCRVVVVDITELKQEEDKVRVSEIRYRRLFETAHDGVLLLDPATRKITDANPFMTQLLGYSRDQFIGKELFEIGLLKDENASQEMFEKLKRKHEVRYEDLPLESDTGRHQEVEVVANLYSENGHAVIQCNIRDITQRKKAEIALLRLAAIVESSDDAIVGKDLNGIVTNWNRGAEKIFGYSAREMVGTSITRLIPADRPDEENHILGKLRRGESVDHFETLRKTKDGRLINVSVTSSPIRDATGKVIGASKVARDTTKQIQAEAVQRRLEVLATSNKKLEAEIVRRQVVEASLKQSEQQQALLLEQSRSMQDQLRDVSRQVLEHRKTSANASAASCTMSSPRR